MCVPSFLLDYLSAQRCTCFLSLSLGVLFKVSRDGCLNSLIMNDKKKKENPNLYWEHDQNVSNNSDQTQRSSHQDDEHYLHGSVGASREEADVTASADVGAVGWILSIHSVWCPSHIDFRLESCLRNPWQQQRFWKNQGLCIYLFLCVCDHRCKIMCSFQLENHWQVFGCFVPTARPRWAEQTGVRKIKAAAGVFTEASYTLVSVIAKLVHLYAVKSSYQVWVTYRRD